MGGGLWRLPWGMTKRPTGAPEPDGFQGKYLTTLYLSSISAKITKMQVVPGSYSWTFRSPTRGRGKNSMSRSPTHGVTWLFVDACVNPLKLAVLVSASQGSVLTLNGLLTVSSENEKRDCLWSGSRKEGATQPCGDSPHARLFS